MTAVAREELLGQEDVDAVLDARSRGDVVISSLGRGRAGAGGEAGEEGEDEHVS